MKSTLFASSALALVLSTGVAFAGPTAKITDAGDTNINVIDQSAKQNSATSATIEQLSGVDGGSLSTNAYIKQAGAGQIDGKISQKNGTGNYALLDQSDGIDTTKTLTSATIHPGRDGFSVLHGRSVR